MSDKGPIFFVVSASAFAVLILFVIPKLDRQRIREQIETHGGKVIEILRDWFAWGRGSARHYDVTYVTRSGERITATCMTSMMSGVQWVSNRPPGSDMRAAAAVEEMEPSKETEPIDCIQCGAKMPAGEVRCTQCGWSYKSSSKS